jgi:uncharacterized membrane protein
LTIYLTWQFVGWIDDAVTPLIPAKYNPESYLPFTLPGLGLLVAVLFLTFIGFITANIFGRTIIKIGERVVNQMPIVRSIYSGLKQVFETLFKQSSQSFRQAVLLEWPRRDIWTVAFVTADTDGEIERRLGHDFLTIYVPTTPNPTSGYTMVVPKKDVVYLDMPVEEAMKMVISMGVLSPDDPVANTPRAIGQEPTEEEPSKSAEG